MKESILSREEVRKPRKVREGSREWKRREREVLDSYAPRLVNCRDCGSPRHEHYCCRYCGSGR